MGGKALEAELQECMLPEAHQYLMQDPLYKAALETDCVMHMYFIRDSSELNVVLPDASAGSPSLKKLRSTRLVNVNEGHVRPARSKIDGSGFFYGPGTHLIPK